MSRSGQGDSNQRFHNPSYNLRNTQKRQEEAAFKSKSEPLKRTSPFSVTNAYNSLMEGVTGTFGKKRLNQAVSETPALSLGRPTETSTPASSFPRDLLLSQSRVGDAMQTPSDPQFPNATRKASARSSTSSAAEDQPTVVERTEANDIYMDETRVYGQTDLLTGLPAQIVPTLNFTMGSDQVLRTETC